MKVGPPESRMLEGAPRVLLARHGETEWNAKGLIQGNVDIPLSAVGRAQSEALARRLALDPPARIVSSDLSRAVETADVVARLTGIAVEKDPALREQNLGAWEGLHFMDVRARWPEEARLFHERAPHFRPGGGESREEMQARVAAALERHAPRPGDGTVLVVAHGGVLSLLLYAVLGLPLASPRRFLLPNAGLTTLHRVDGAWHVATLNDTAHLGASGSATFPFE